MAIRDRGGMPVITARYYLIWQGAPVSEYDQPRDAVAACDRNPGSHVEYEVIEYGADDDGHPEEQTVHPRKHMYPGTMYP